MSQTKSATGLLIGRFFLGAIEAGLYPGALFILTCWYTKKEVGEYLATDFSGFDMWLT